MTAATQWLISAKVQWLASAKQALTHLGQVEGVETFLDQLDRTELVALGQRLWWLNKRANKVLDGIKIRLRDEAAAQGGSGTCRFDSPDGSHCLIIPHASSLGLRKDADIEAVKTLLGPRWRDFFDEVITYKPRKDFQNRTAACTPAEQAALLGVIDLSDRTPRVVFKD